MQMAAQRVASDHAHVPGISRVLASQVQGTPVIAVIAITPKPNDFPKALRVRLSATETYALPIVWQQIVADNSVAKGMLGTHRGAKNTRIEPVQRDRPIDDAMWGGGTPVEDRPGTLITPGQQPLVSVMGQIPPTEQERYQLAVNARLPQFADPNFWAKPFDQTGSVCTDLYETEYLTFAYTVPSDYMVIVSGVSYQFDDVLVPFDQFEVSIYRDTERLAVWNDMRALTTADPAEEYVFAGHYRPMPFYGRFDHDQVITARVKVLGQYPFTHTSADALGGCFHIFLTGWMPSLMDSRDGGARPVDMGDLNPLALGTAQPARTADHYDRPMRY